VGTLDRELMRLDSADEKLRALFREARTRGILRWVERPKIQEKALREKGIILDTVGRVKLRNDAPAASPAPMPIFLSELENRGFTYEL
jgi:hypothetical protein